MDNSRITELMVKKAGKVATEEELRELNTLLSKHPDYSYLSEIVQSLKGSDEHVEINIPKEELVNHGWQHLSGKLNSSANAAIQKRHGLLKFMFSSPLRRVAAAVVTIAIGTTVVFYFQTVPGPAGATKIAKVNHGTTTVVTLADGSKVWLNAGSKLTYPDKFTSPKREVSLEGEGLFEVTKNANVPFLVHAGKLTIKVLGTKFNVKAYKEDENIETTLLSGKVQVMLDDDPENNIILSPSEKLTVSNLTAANNGIAAGHDAGNELKYEVKALHADSNNNFTETAWVKNKLMFSNEPFENVARRLERKYDVRIYFIDETLKKERLSSVFEKESIEQVLEILKMTTRFSYKMDKDTVYIFKRKM